MKTRIGWIVLLVVALLLVAWPGWPQTATHSISLSWTASTSVVAGYNVYRGTVTGGPYTKLNTAPITALAYTDTTGAGGTKYFYVATAVDSAGVESIYSNEASAIFLSPPLPPAALAAVSK